MEGQVERSVEGGVAILEGRQRGSGDDRDLMVRDAGLPPPAARQVGPARVRVDGHDRPIGRLAERQPEGREPIRSADLDDPPPAGCQHLEDATAGPIHDGHARRHAGRLDGQQGRVERGGHRLDVVEVDQLRDIATT